MAELIETIVKALVDHPEEVRVTEHMDGNKLVYQLSVHSIDMGKVIGKQGRVAKAIRTVVNAAGAHNNKQIALEIV
ncbi:KH domain-containing protein [Fictibacillus macauensis]|uniref:KH domain-containing protein n=1 Tax=Fictibacillus macauensis TaxID=245160 RepID=UPI00058FCBE9|nr:KH domain-containing protein [Fictibacillus macauensis]